DDEVGWHISSWWWSRWKRRGGDVNRTETAHRREHLVARRSHQSTTGNRWSRSGIARTRASYRAGDIPKTFGRSDRGGLSSNGVGVSARWSEANPEREGKLSLDGQLADVDAGNRSARH